MSSSSYSWRCAYCGDRSSRSFGLETHILTRHRDKVNWKRVEEVYVGVWSMLLSQFSGPTEVEKELDGIRKWQYFAPNPARSLVEFGLPSQGSPGAKKELQPVTGFLATSGLKRADLVFYNPHHFRAVIVENKKRMTEKAFEQVQLYAGLLWDDFPCFSEPRTVVNFHGENQSLTGERESNREAAGGELTTPTRIISATGRLSVFDLPEEHQQFLDVDEHWI